MRTWKWPARGNLAVGLILILLLLAFQYQDRLEQWLVRLSMCALFCTVIYLREHAGADRWIAIAIITAGTLLSIVLMR